MSISHVVYIADEHNVDRFINLLKWQRDISSYTFTDFLAKCSRWWYLLPRHVSAKVYDYIYERTNNIDVSSCSADVIKRFLQNYEGDKKVIKFVIEYLLTVDDDQKLDDYMCAMFRAYSTFELFVCCCKYNDVAIIDYFLTNKQAAIVKMFSDDEYYETSEYYDADAYMRDIISCDRGDVIVPLMSSAHASRCHKGPTIIKNVIHAIKRNNLPAVQMYFSRMGPPCDEALNTLKYVFNKDIYICDEIFRYLIEKASPIFFYDDYVFFAKHGKHVDFGEYDIESFSVDHIQRLACMPNSTLYERMLERQSENICANKLLTMFAYYVTQNNMTMIDALENQFEIDYTGSYYQLIVYAYLSNADAAFTHIFWKDAGRMSYVYFIMCMDRADMFVPREIIKKILEPIVFDFWDNIVLKSRKI